MTFKDLKKRVSVTQNTQYQNRLFEKLHDKPFWIWNAEEHRAEDIGVVEQWKNGIREAFPASNVVTGKQSCEKDIGAIAV